MLFGQTPVNEVLAFLDEELAWARERGLAAVEADALLGGPYLYSRLGRFDEARERLERSKGFAVSSAAPTASPRRTCGGRPDGDAGRGRRAAERELRDAIRVATEMGATRYVALYRTRIAHVLIARGKDDDALAELEQARESPEPRHRGRRLTRGCSHAPAKRRSRRTRPRCGRVGRRQ